MTAEQMPQEHRLEDFFSHIDMGFLNRRRAITRARANSGRVHRAAEAGRRSHDGAGQRSNLLVTMLIDICSTWKAPTLAEALRLGEPRHMFMSIERLEPCPEVYDAHRVSQGVHLEFDCGKPVTVAYHTRYICSDTGKMTLSEGWPQGHREAMIGLLHDKGDRFEIEPFVIGAPYLDHPRNAAKGGSEAVWGGQDYGEILPEDITEFAKITEARAEDAAEWMSVMSELPEATVKEAIARLLTEPVKKDWGGEENDHFSANVTVGGRRRTAAFLLKGPTNFREMTLAMCGKNADQIYRLTRAGADISIVQHAHLIGPAVRETLKAMVVTPGHTRKFCVIDGQATYRLLKAYGLLPSAVADLLQTRKGLDVSG